MTGLRETGRRISDRLGAVERRLGRSGLLVLGGLAAAAAAAVVFVVFVFGGGGASEVTASEFDQVKPGVSEESVRNILGEPDHVGSQEFQVSQQTTPAPVAPGVPALPTTTQATVEENDCWFYPVGGETGGQVQFGPGETLQLSLSVEGEAVGSDEAVICFDEAHAVSIASGPFGPLSE